MASIGTSSGRAWHARQTAAHTTRARVPSTGSRDWIGVRPMNLHYPIIAMGFGENYEEGKLSPKFGFEWHPKEKISLPLKIRLNTTVGEVLYDELTDLDKLGWVEGRRGVSDRGMS